MAAEDFTAEGELDSEDLFDFSEKKLGEGAGATAPLAEEDLDEVLRAAKDLQDELGGSDALIDDGYSVKFAKGTLDGEDGDDLFSFDDLFPDEGSPDLDERILQGELGGSTAEPTRAPARSKPAPASEPGAEPQPTPRPKSAKSEPVAEKSAPSGSRWTETAPEDLRAKASRAPKAPSKTREPRAKTASKPRRSAERAPRETPEEFLASARRRAKAERSVTFWPIVGGLVALNVTILLVGLAAVFQIGSEMRGVNTSLASSLRTIAEESRPERVIVQLPATPLETAKIDEASTQRAPAPAATEPSVQRTVPPLELEPRERTELRAAHDEIAGGKFAVARRRLFRLLAVADSPLSEAGRSAEQEANLLIAQSYEAEAAALASAAGPRASR